MNSTPEYAGVFDLPAGGGGLNDSERLLASLCRKSFLSLWAFPNLHTDEGSHAGDSSGKEFTDVLMVFGDDLVLFSDKHVAFNEDKSVEVAWVRWHRRAIQKSIKQLYGALHWLKRFPTRIFLDAKCSRPLPINLPDPTRARYHLVAVTRGSYGACAKWFRGSIGTLPIRTDIAGEADPRTPFTIGRGEPGKPFVHVFDEFSLEVILREFDTAVDFVSYLKAREAFLTDPNHIVAATGEEQLVASYLLNMRGEEHWFTPAFEEGERLHLLSFTEDIYPALRTRPEYLAKKRADELSYFWDALIEQFIRLGDPKVVDARFMQDNAQTEEGLRIIASESRFRRRVLAETLKAALVKARATPGIRLARTFAATYAAELLYVFLIMPKSAKDSYEDYRKHRISVLHAYCRCAKLRFPAAKTFIGLSFDHPVRDYKASSEDLFIYKCDSLTDEERREAERLRSDLGILPDTLVPEHTHADEFPEALRPPDRAKTREDVHRPSANEGARKRKHKRDMVKASRRRNRRKK